MVIAYIVLTFMAGAYGYIEEGRPLGWMIIWPIALIIGAVTQSIAILGEAMHG